MKRKRSKHGGLTISEEKILENLETSFIKAGDGITQGEATKYVQDISTLCKKFFHEDNIRKAILNRTAILIYWPSVSGRPLESEKAKLTVEWILKKIHVEEPMEWIHRFRDRALDVSGNNSIDVPEIPDMVVPVSCLYLLYFAEAEFYKDMKIESFNLSASAAHQELVCALGGMPSTKKKNATVVAVGVENGLRYNINNKWHMIIPSGKIYQKHTEIDPMLHKLFANEGVKTWLGIMYLASLENGNTSFHLYLDRLVEALGYSERTRYNPKRLKEIAGQIQILTMITLYKNDSGSGSTVKGKAKILELQNANSSKAIDNSIPKQNIYDKMLNKKAPLRKENNTEEQPERSEKVKTLLENHVDKKKRLSLIKSFWSVTIHPNVYDGIVKIDENKPGTNFIPVPKTLLTVNHKKFPYVHVLGAVLSIRFRWVLQKKNQSLTLSGKKLLKIIDLEKANKTQWRQIEQNLDKLKDVKLLSSYKWKSSPQTLDGMIEFHPAHWIIDRTLFRILPSSSIDQLVPKNGADLRKWRENEKITQQGLAEKLSLGRSTIFRAEKNKDLSLSGKIKQPLKLLIANVSNIDINSQ